MLSKRFLPFCLAFAIVAALTTPRVLAQTTASTISGTLIDLSRLPVGGATVDLYSDSSTKIATVTSSADGTFSFSNEPPGVYYAIVCAAGYNATQSDDIVATNGAVARIRIGLAKASAGESTQTIGRVSSNLTGSSVLQSSATITQSVDSKVLQQEGYLTALAGLQNPPGITTNADSSRDNDGTLRISSMRCTPGASTRIKFRRSRCCSLVSRRRRCSEAPSSFTSRETMQSDGEIAVHRSRHKGSEHDSSTLPHPCAAMPRRQ